MDLITVSPDAKPVSYDHTVADKFMLSKLNEQRLAKNHVDVTLVAKEDKILYAHGIVLRSQSSVFTRIIKSKDVELDLRHHDVSIISDALTYVYIGTITLSIHNVIYLVEFGIEYDIVSLINVCISYLCDILDLNNITTIVQVYTRLDLVSLRDRVLQYIAVNLPIVLNSRTSILQHLSITDITDILSYTPTECINRTISASCRLRLLLMYVADDIDRMKYLDNIPTLLPDLCHVPTRLRHELTKKYTDFAHKLTPVFDTVRYEMIFEPFNSHTNVCKSSILPQMVDERNVYIPPDYDRPEIGPIIRIVAHFRDVETSLSLTRLKLYYRNNVKVCIGVPYSTRDLVYDIKLSTGQDERIVDAQSCANGMHVHGIVFTSSLNKRYVIGNKYESETDPTSLLPDVLRNSSSTYLQGIYVMTTSTVNIRPIYKHLNIIFTWLDG